MTPEPPGYLPQGKDRWLSLLLKAAHAVEARTDELLGTVQLSLPKYSALAHLAQAGEPLSLGELASRMTCVRSNITQLIDRLEADGFVGRVEDPKDRRIVRAALTDLGKQRQAEGVLLLQKMRNQVIEAFSELDPGTLERALESLL